MGIVQEFFDVILAHESKTYNDYNWYDSNGLHSHIEGVSNKSYPLLKKPLSQYSLGEIKAFQAHSRDNKGQLWATGRFQVIPSTLISAQNRLKLSDSAIYDEWTQNIIGVSILTNRTNIKKYLNGSVPDTIDNLKLASLDVARIWSSVGVPFPTQGNNQFVQTNQSYYSGGGDTARVKTEDVQQALKKLRTNYQALQKEVSSPPKKKIKWIAPTAIGISLATLIFVVIKIKNSKTK